jgi:hypothetical protein
MATGQLISIIAVIIPSATTLLVAHWHRKQARQLEAFRLDPSVGLNPPPSPVRVHFRKHWQLWLYLLGTGIQVACLVRLLRGSEPITRVTIVAFSVIIGAIFTNLVLGIIQFVQRQISGVVETQRTTISIIAKQADTITLISETLNVTAETIEKTRVIAELKEQVAALRKSVAEAT